MNKMDEFLTKWLPQIQHVLAGTDPNRESAPGPQGAQGKDWQSHNCRRGDGLHMDEYVLRAVNADYLGYLS